MAQILVREIEDDVKERLQKRAARHRRSMAAEVRDILRDAVKHEDQPSDGLGSEMAALFKGIGLQEGQEIPELPGLTLKKSVRGMIILDTSVVSAVMRGEPDRAVLP